MMVMVLVTVWWWLSCSVVVIVLKKTRVVGLASFCGLVELDDEVDNVGVTLPRSI